MSNSVIEIVKGADFQIDFRLTKDGVPEPLDSPDEITVLLPAEDNEVNSIEFTLTGGGVEIESDPRGEFRVVGDETESATLKAALNQDMTIIIKRGTEDITKNIKKRLNIEEPALQSPS